MTYKLKPLTETSWLVLGDSGDLDIGLITKAQEEYTLMSRGVRKRFQNTKELFNYFKEDIFKNILVDDQGDKHRDVYINGYPVSCEEPTQLILKGNTLPLFTKKDGSETYYAAGYYCLRFPHNWMPAFCPKLNTLNTYQYSGPYKTELEMKQNLARLRKLKSSSERVRETKN